VPIATDLRVSVVKAGLLVSIFAFAYATSLPVLTVLTGRLDRRRLLISSMSLFAFLNIGAAMAHRFLALASARVLFAFGAGPYTPNANALARGLSRPQAPGTAPSGVDRARRTRRWGQDSPMFWRMTRLLRLLRYDGFTLETGSVE